MDRLKGKVAIITGGAGGIGEATVRKFLENGAKVVIADVQDERGEALAKELGEDTKYVHLDVREEADWEGATAVASEFGPLTVLVNNAGILLSASLTDTDKNDYLRVIEVNQLGTFLGIRAAIEPMKAAGGGSIINMSSVDGLQSGAGVSAYSSSKWAVRGLTKNAAIELGRYGIRVNSVHPGGIYTEMGGAGRISEEDINQLVYANHPIPRVGQPEEVSNVVLFLATDEASYSTGAEFLADGGWSAGLRDPLRPSA